MNRSHLARAAAAVAVSAGALALLGLLSTSHADPKPTFSTADCAHLTVDQCATLLAMNDQPNEAPRKQEAQAKAEPKKPEPKVHKYLPVKHFGGY